MLPTDLRLTVLIPVYNDWPAANLLLHELDRSCAEVGLRPRVLLVNDGSTHPLPSPFFSNTLHALDRVEVLELYRNLGHQRALCVGMVYLYTEAASDAVLVMDADGEDSPRDVPSLVRCFVEEDRQKIVFAARARRLEGAIFKLFYQIYRTIHRIFVGFDVRIGNFSVIPYSRLAALVRSGHLWNHYAAAAVKARLPIAAIPINKAKRLHGNSKMGFVGLLLHGLSAMSVNNDTIGARMLLALCILFCMGLAGLAVVIFIRFSTLLAIPGWATLASGIILLLLFQILTIALLFTFGVLATRALPEFIPLRDCPQFVMGLKRIDRPHE